MKNKIFFSWMLLSMLSAYNGRAQDDFIADIDGNMYKTVIIGTQTWMAENLRTSRLHDGTAITYAEKNALWATSPMAYCWYDNDTAYKSSYGAIYNWQTINSKKLCPAGWHVASETDWLILMDQAGGKSLAGGKLKESGTTHWVSPNTGATNESGFSALPGGGRANIGFFKIGTTGFWWTSSTSGMGVPRYVTLKSNNEKLSFAEYNASYGFSVRCIKDQE